MAEIKTLGFSSSEPGTNDLFIDIDLILTTLPGVVSAYTAFPNTFASAPDIVGAPNCATTGVSMSAAANTVGVTIYAFAAETGDGPDATVSCTVYVKGKLA